MINEKQIAEMREFSEKTHSSEEWMAFYQTNFGPLLSTAEDLWPIARAAKRWISAAAGREASEAEASLEDALEVLKGSL